MSYAMETSCHLAKRKAYDKFVFFTDQPESNFLAIPPAIIKHPPACFVGLLFFSFL